MEPPEIQRALKTGLSLLTDPAFSALTNFDGLKDLKNLIAHLIRGELTIIESGKLTTGPTPVPIPPMMPVPPKVGGAK